MEIVDVKVEGQVRVGISSLGRAGSQLVSGLRPSRSAASHPEVEKDS